MIPPKRRLWQRVWGSVGGGAVGLVGMCAWPYTVDDAFIVARYATRVARNLGYNFNAGPSTDGITGPAWLLPGIVATRLGLDPVSFAKLTGLVCACAAGLLAVLGLAGRAQGRALLVVSALLIALEPSLACSGVSGLETGAACLLLVIAARATLGRPRAHPLLAGSALAALPWLRPELAVASALLLGALLRRVGSRAALPALLCVASSGLALCAFRFALAGTILPLALLAKPAELSHGLDYALRALFVQSGGLGAGLALAGAWLGRSDDRWLFALLVAHALACVLAGGDWMPGFRLFVPILPLYAALAAVGCVRLLRRGRAATGCALIALACALIVPVLDLATRLPELRASGASRDGVGRELALWLHAHSRRVALVDIGYLGYASEREMIDLAGITDPEVARFAGGHLSKQLPPGWLERVAPDTLVLHSSTPPTAAGDGRLLQLQGYPVEMRAARDAWVQRTFRVALIRRYASNYHYVVLQRGLAR